MASYSVLNDDLIEVIAEAPDAGQYLVLGNHPDFQGQWVVQSLDPGFQFDFESVIGPYRAVSPARLGEFLDLAKELDYQVVFEDDPEQILDAYKHLNEPPCVALNSNMEGVVNGLLPWQVQAFNKLKDRSGKLCHDTGTGKTACAAALIKYLVVENPQFNLCFYLAKAHNKVNTQRKLKQLGDIESVVIEASTPQKRADLYADLFDRLENGERLVLITNYEKFREDELALKLLCTDRDLLMFYDEMPTRLSNRSTKLYGAFLRCIWRTKDDSDTAVPNPLTAQYRVKSYRAYELTATPIENNPEGDFNATRLIDPNVFGSISSFRSEYVSKFSFFDRNKPEEFHRLDKFARVQDHIVHRVSKKDPDVAKYFPKVRYEPIYIDWDPRDRKNYDTLTGKVKNELLTNLEDANVLAMMTVMQMMCDAPSMVNVSAENRARYEATWKEMADQGVEIPKKGSLIAMDLLESLGTTLKNDRHTKLDTLRELITEKHADEKILVYTAFGPMLLPILSDKLNEWGVSHVTYAGTNIQRQAAQDHFRTDPACRVFLSSDAGSDSIDLEQASVGIDYDLPYKYTTRVQRWNRANRPNSTHVWNIFYSLLMVNSVEERRLEIVEQKKSYHDAIYEGVVNDASMSARMTRQELIYTLTGDWV